MGYKNYPAMPVQVPAHPALSRKLPWGVAAKMYFTKTKSGGLLLPKLFLLFRWVRMVAAAGSIATVGFPVDDLIIAVPLTVWALIRIHGIRSTGQV